MKWLRILLLPVILLGLNGCSALDAMGVLNPDKPSIEVNANVGKNIEQEKSNIKLESGTKVTKQDADSISNDSTTSYQADVVNQITNNLTIEQLLWFGLVCFFTGVLCPDVPRMYGAAKYVIIDICYGIFVTPLKGAVKLYKEIKS